MNNPIRDSFFKNNRSRQWGWSIGSLLFLLPLIANQLSDEVTWGILDFTVFGLMIVMAGLALEFGLRKSKSRTFQVVLTAAVLGAFLLVWVLGAVGMD